MKRNFIPALLALALSTLLSGCAERNHNIISKNRMQAIKKGDQAIIVMQTTPITPDKYLKGVETYWANTSYLHKSFSTKNYQLIYIYPLKLTNYKYYDIEVYTLPPGEYSLKKVKYIGSENSISEIYNTNKDINFSVKAGEILYIGDLVLDLKDTSTAGLKGFFTRSISFQDNYSFAKTYIEKNYPDLSAKLEKKLIINKQ